MSDTQERAAVRTLLKLGYTWDEYWRPPLASNNRPPLAKDARSVAAIVGFDTTDPRLFLENIDLGDIEATVRFRQAVLDNLPKLTRVFALMSENEARLMLGAHTYVASRVGLTEFIFPPTGYRPPGRRPPI